jgi:hypothetical protein
LERRPSGIDGSIHKGIPSTGSSGGIYVAVGIGQLFTICSCSAFGWSGWKGVSVGGKIGGLPESDVDKTGGDPPHELVLKKINRIANTYTGLCSLLTKVVLKAYPRNQT